MGRGGEHLSRHFRADTSWVVMLPLVEQLPLVQKASLQSLQEHDNQQGGGETRSLLVSFLKILEKNSEILILKVKAGP